MQDRKEKLSPDEIAEYVVPIIKLFNDIFHGRNETIMSIDLVHIITSVATSITASCIESHDPTNEPKFKLVIGKTVEVLMSVYEGTQEYESKTRIS